MKHRSLLTVSTILFSLAVASGCKSTQNASQAAAAAALSSTRTLPSSTMPVVKEPWVLDCTKLDYGIYWFGPGNVAQKAEPGHQSQFFNNQAPTVVYVHGWQNDSVKKGRREAFHYQDPKTQNFVYTADAWIKAGWNVGVFYWTQFASETDLLGVESKIWLADGAGPATWQTCDGNASTEGAPKGSMARAFYTEYLSAMQGYEGSDIRLVGHSLGNQMASRLTNYLLDASAANTLPSTLVPKRLALLDPYWSLGNAVAAYPGAEVRQIVQKAMDRGLAVEMYKNSNLLALGSIVLQGDRNLPLTALIGESRQDVGFIADDNFITAQTAKHVAAPPLYFLSFGCPVPKGCEGTTCSPQARSAAVSNVDTMSAANTKQIWQQTQGGNTLDCADDVYEKKDASDQGSL